jgi:acyl-CoA dehydrogenase
MISFTRGDREIALQEKTRAFIRAHVIPYEGDPRLTRHGPDESLLHELHAKAREAGLFTPQAPEEWGGLGLCYREIATVFKEAGYSLLGPLAMNCMAPDEGNMHLLATVATREQKHRFLRPLIAGEMRSAFLMTEPEDGAGSDPGMLQTSARPDGDDWIITGKKWLITGARGASFGIIMARTGERATMFLTDMRAPGIRIERVLDTLDHTMPGGHAIVHLDELRVHRDLILGAPDEGFRYAQVRLAPARLTHCMRWWGAAKRAHDIATAYACRRQAFGKHLIDHEGVGFMLAKNEVELLQTELLIDRVAWALDRGESAGSLSSMAKYACGETLYGIVDRCVQVLGGQGITGETPVGAILCELRAFRIYDGPSEVHLYALANRIKRKSASVAVIHR